MHVPWKLSPLISTSVSYSPLLEASYSTEQSKQTFQPEEKFPYRLFCESSQSPVQILERPWKIESPTSTSAVATTKTNGSSGNATTATTAAATKS